MEPHGLKRYKEPKNQKNIDEKIRKYMNDKQKNDDVRSGSYQQKKWGDKQNQKYQKSEKTSGIHDGVYSTGLNYTNGA